MACSSRKTSLLLRLSSLQRSFKRWLLITLRNTTHQKQSCKEAVWMVLQNPFNSLKSCITSSKTHPVLPSAILRNLWFTFFSHPIPKQWIFIWIAALQLHLSVSESRRCIISGFIFLFRVRFTDCLSLNNFTVANSPLLETTALGGSRKPASLSLFSAFCIFITTDFYKCKIFTGGQVQNGMFLSFLFQLHLRLSN